MAEKLHACLVKYFARLEKLDCEWKEHLKNAKISLTILANQAERFRAIMELDATNTDIDKEMIGKLIYLIYMDINEEVILLSDIVTRLNDINQDLKNHVRHLKANSKISLKDEAMQELINGTSHRPSLDNLIIWCMKSSQYYDKMYLRIKNSMKLINCKEKDTIDDLISSFKEESHERKKMDRIFIFTQFLSQENLHRRDMKRNCKRTSIHIANSEIEPVKRDVICVEDNI